MGSTPLGIIRLLTYLSWTAVAIPVQWVALKLGLSFQTSFPRFYHRTCARICGMRLDIRGTVARRGPTLFVCNHSSYLDITVLGGIIEGTFIAKQDVATWPFFGLLAKLQRSIFVDRRASQVLRDRQELVRRLEEGSDLILFPEGTSTDGNRTLPFKSALFAVAETEVAGKPILVQPVSVSCTHLDGIPVGRDMRSIYSWFGDMDLVTHLWSMVRLGDLTITVQFHPPVSFADFGSRKALSDHCWSQVANGVANANAGRIRLPVAV
ncbi:MAG: 1-acyl-sn-glycerol-3-phosphate acyltransferase [Rhodospirillaceae bacterium]|nr:1-acyl-sn-glycerol-3-phosphate acyltransferase [Rhodospirillaceae bacterium]